MKCLAENCSRNILAKGLCGLHYKRMRVGKKLDGTDWNQQSLPRGGLALLGLTKHHPFYMAWVNMKTRCDNPAATQWEWYGKRGIRYCDAWKQFVVFYNDMFPKWWPGASLDRIDTNGNYEPNNCRWIPISFQVNNRRPWGANKQA